MFGPVPSREQIEAATGRELARSADLDRLQRILDEAGQLPGNLGLLVLKAISVAATGGSGGALERAAALGAEAALKRFGG